MPTSPSYHGTTFSDRDQPTLNTVKKYVDEARVLIQDVLPAYRYSDPSILSAINIAMLETSRKRQDLFVFNTKVNGQVQAFTAVDDTYVEIEPPFRLGVLFRICGHAVARDQEDYQDARATAFFAMSDVVLIGRSSTPPLVGGSGPGGQR
jgi:hypothetical protein